MQFATTIQKAYVLEANATGINTVKDQKKFFFNLEKQQGAQNTIKKLLVDDKETADQAHILECIKEVYQNIFKKREQKEDQRQTIIRLIEKNVKIRNSYKTGRPISLLNVDVKIISKALSEKLLKVLPDLISTQQTAYVKNRHISESGRLISDIIDIARLRKLEGFLVAMDIEKAFDSLDYNLLISALEK